MKRSPSLPARVAAVAILTGLTLVNTIALQRPAQGVRRRVTTVNGRSAANGNRAAGPKTWQCASHAPCGSRKDGWRGEGWNEGLGCKFGMARRPDSSTLRNFLAAT